jgi:hypothetical protein
VYAAVGVHSHAAVLVLSFHDMDITNPHPSAGERASGSYRRWVGGLRPRSGAPRTYGNIRGRSTGSVTAGFCASVMVCHKELLLPAVRRHADMMRRS